MAEETLPEGPTTTVWVTDPERALRELPGLIVAEGFILLHYEQASATLEETFFELVEGGA